MSAQRNPKQQARPIALNDEVLGRLSPDATAVLALAQKYAERLDAIHMEHLLFALVDRDTKTTRVTLQRSGLNRNRLVEALSTNRRFNIPMKPLEAGDLIAPVMVSAHVAEAIAHVATRRLETSDLLVGLLSVSNCALVEKLKELDIDSASALRALYIVQSQEKQQSVLTEVEELERQASSSVGSLALVTEAPRESRKAISREQANHYRTKLTSGTDDERQEMVDRIAAESASMDFSLLRDDLMDGLRSGLLRDNGAPLSEALSWMITALGYVSNAGDAEVLTLLRETLASSRETSELIRFWSLVALTRIGDAAAGQSISASDRTGLVGMLADALRERGAPRAPSALLAALLGPNEYPQWSALLVLRVVAFPSLIPQMCELLQRVSKNPSSQVPYNVLLALANPEIVDAAARALESSLGTRVVVENAVRAMRNSSLRRVAEFARVVMRLDKRGVERSLNGLAASPDENTAQAALVLMERLGLEELEEIAPVAGYLTDSIPEANQALKDEIGIDKDVKTLCSVLLAAEVKPPLAGGLFGDWGTGKSYFMEKMYREIETLAERAKNAKKTAYLKRVVQIRFNAWHYADANLWASLVTHIFDELSKEVNKEESPEETKKRLMSQLDSAKQALNDAVIEQKRAKGESDAAEASLSRVRQDRVDKQIELKQLRVPDLWEILNADEQKELKKELTTAIEELSLEPAIGSVKELNDVYQQAVTLAGRARSAFLSLWRSKDRASLMVLVVFAFVLVPVVGYAITEVVHKAKLAEWIASVSEALVFLGGFAPKIKKHLDTASRYLKQLEEARARALEVIGERRKMVSDAERVKERELERLRVEETAAAQRVAMADAKVLEVTQKLEEIKSGRSLSKFLLERVQADDYRKHLGIVSLIRKDFERLNDLLTKGEGGLEQIGRIILYIDDLDRCPADKVVDVLQATHLLLAMKLFVAIVGVDLRWLLHSLDQRYSAFRADANGDAKGLRPEWVTSPQSYLEKIFQIPFNLKPMEPAGYERLISSLFPKGAEALVPSPGPQEHLDEPAPQDAGQQELLVYVAQKSQMGPQPPTPNAEASKQTAELVDRDLDPAALVIRDWERDFAARMFPFVPSPRAAKRFTNIYRILKAPLASGELREFEGTKESPGDFQAAMLLLAVSTGLPYQTAELFRAILAEGKKLGADGRPSGTWKDIFERFIVEPEKRSVLAQLKLTDRIDPFFKWAPRVGRFTFEAAKAAAKRAVAPEAGAAPNHAVV